MKITRALLLLSFVFVLLASVASADTLQFTGTATNTTLTIHDSTIGTVTGYIDPYLGKLNGLPITMFCVDPNHDVHLNDIWTVNVTVVPTSDWSKTFLQNGNTYGQMAYLAMRMMATNDVPMRQAIQTVIWSLADNTLTADIPAGVNATWWNDELIQLRLDAANHPLTGGFEILTDAAGLHPTSKQEYLVLTPEPTTLMLLGSGLLTGLGFRRRKSC
jgi:hypothetical protein